MQSLPAITENWLSTTHLCISKEVLTRCFFIGWKLFQSPHGGKMSLQKEKKKKKKKALKSLI